MIKATADHMIDILIAMLEDAAYNQSSLKYISTIHRTISRTRTG